MLLFILIALIVVSVPLLVEHRVNPRSSILTGLRKEARTYAESTGEFLSVTVKFVLVAICIVIVGVGIIWAALLPLVHQRLERVFQILIVVVIIAVVYVLSKGRVQT